MEKDRKEIPKKEISPLVKNILFLMKDEDDLSFANGHSKKKMTEILIETEDVFKDFLKNGDEEPFLEFIDSDLEIAQFLSKRRSCFKISDRSYQTQGSVLSHMREQLGKE